MIHRTKYLQAIEELVGKPIVKVLLGMRRTGKSTLLGQIQDSILEKGIPAEQIIFINFEFMENEDLTNVQVLYRHLNSRMTDKDKKYYIFLDEIQEVAGFEKLVNSLNAEGRADIYITGSNSRLLSGELATYLTGRTFSIEVFPLSFEEIYTSNSGSAPGIKKDIEELFIDYLRFGGMPARFQFSKEENIRNYLSDMYRAILLKDIVSRYSIRDVDLLERFLKYVLHNIGQTFSADNITKFLKAEGRKLSKETIYNYLAACKNAYLIYGVPRYDIKGKELLRTSEKYFIGDLGIRSLYYDNENDIGQALENLVFLELLRRGYEVHIGKMENQEIDFIAVKGATKTYIQVAYLLADKKTQEREFSALLKIKDMHPKLVLSMDKINRSSDGIQHVNVISFLLDQSR